MKPPRPKLYVTDVKAVKRFQKKYAPKLRQDYMSYKMAGGWASFGMVFQIGFWQPVPFPLNERYP